MTCQQYDFIIVAEHATGSAFFDYLELFDDIFICLHTGKLAVITPPSKYNGIWFRDIISKEQVYNAVKIINGQEKMNLCVLTRDPILQLVSAFNLWMFTACQTLLGQTSTIRYIRKLLLQSSSRHELFNHWMILNENDAYHKKFLFCYRLLPFFQNRINDVYVIDTHDVLPENVYSTLEYFKQNFFNSEIDYTRVDVNISTYSVYTGWMFYHVPAFRYFSNDMTFSLRPWPLQLNWLQRVPENTYISYEPEEVEWTCGTFDGPIAFNLVTKGMTQQMILELMPRIKEICEANDKRLLREYCRKTSFTVNMAYGFYEILKTSKEEVLEILKTGSELSEKVKSKIYAQAAALQELGYDVTKHWTATAELFEGGNILPTEHKYDHLYAVINELKEQLLQQGEDLEKLMEVKSEKDKYDAALKQKHQVSSLSKKQKLLFRLITPIVRKFTSEAQFKRFQETPALFFKSLKKRKYRIFGELFFPARRGLF